MEKYKITRATIIGAGSISVDVEVSDIKQYRELLAKEWDIPTNKILFTYEEID